MPRYTYDPAIPFAQNKDRAIAFHSQWGPMVPVVVEEAGDKRTSHWLFATGAVLGAGALAGMEEPAPRPDPGSPVTSWEWDAFRATVRRILNYWRLRGEQAAKEFEGLKKVQERNPDEEGIRRLEQLLEEMHLCRTRREAIELVLKPAVVEPVLSPEQQHARAREQTHRQRLSERVARLATE